MEERILQEQFAKIGARLEIDVMSTRVARVRGRGWRRVRTPQEFTLDVRRDKKGEVFDLVIRPDVYRDLELIAVDVRPEQRHLLLMARGLGDKQKFLCGHDERHWFVAAVPDSQSVKNVRDAMEALKPREVRVSQRLQGVKTKNRNKRRNAGYVRQGEWFFVPCPDLEPEDAQLVLHNEPIQRSGGTPHIVERLYRCGGTTVYVSQRYPSGLTEQDYRRLIERDPETKNLRWRVMHRDAKVYAMGKVRHPDHKTIVLPFWHRVIMSAENRSGNVVFLD